MYSVCILIKFCFVLFLFCIAVDLVLFVVPPIYSKYQVMIFQFLLYTCAVTYISLLQTQIDQSAKEIYCKVAQAIERYVNCLYIVLIIRVPILCSVKARIPSFLMKMKAD